MTYQTKSILTVSSQQAGADFMKKHFPNGPIKGNSPMRAARGFLEATLNVLNQLLVKEGSQVRLSIDVDHSRYVPPGFAGGAGLVRGLIVFDGAKTLVVDMAVSPTLLRLAGKPTFLIHPEAVPFLMRALIEAAVDVLDAKHKVAA
jgi:hypothetical protein